MGRDMRKELVRHGKAGGKHQRGRIGVTITRIKKMALIGWRARCGGAKKTQGDYDASGIWHGRL